MSPATPWPRVALLSLSEKAGAVEFARALAERGTRLIASAGTAKHLADAGLEVAEVEEWTGFPELLGGRVKTLHPHVHAPILARRGEASDMTALSERGLDPIDLVAVTLYPFELRAARLDEASAIEEIDIGGVALLRAAAKNFASVIVAHDPAQYTEVLDALAKGPTLDQRRAWALAAFARTARYDAAIAGELSRRAGEDLPPIHVLALDRVRGLRYGENPHQEAALYAHAGDAARLSTWREGKELSYNNLLDLAAASALVHRFEQPACVIVKHAQPCGVAEASTLVNAYRAALRTDEVSAFGGVLAFNRTVDADTAGAVAQQFVEVVVAPSFDTGAAEVLGAKKNLRILTLDPPDESAASWDVREAGRWVLLQRESDAMPAPWKCVTAKQPSPEQLEALRFAWEVVAAARSNAIAIAQGTALVGIGSGQTSRVDAVDVALMKARRAGHELKGAVLASDGFFPFGDGIDHAAEAKIAAVVQPGGSVRDAEVVAACERHGIVMMFTDLRTFRH